MLAQAICTLTRLEAGTTDPSWSSVRALAETLGIYIARTDLQDIVDELLAKGFSASTVAGAMLPMRAIYRRAMSRGEVAINPTTGLQIPAARGGRDRIASPEGARRSSRRSRRMSGRCGRPRCSVACDAAS
jgi:hypothetical protein